MTWHEIPFLMPSVSHSTKSDLIIIVKLYVIAHIEHNHVASDNMVI